MGVFLRDRKMNFLAHCQLLDSPTANPRVRKSGLGSHSCQNINPNKVSSRELLYLLA